MSKNVKKEHLDKITKRIIENDMCVMGSKGCGLIVGSVHDIVATIIYLIEEAKSECPQIWDVIIDYYNEVVKKTDKDMSELQDMLKQLKSKLTDMIEKDKKED